MGINLAAIKIKQILVACGQQQPPVIWKFSFFLYLSLYFFNIDQQSEQEAIAWLFCSHTENPAKLAITPRSLVGKGLPWGVADFGSVC